MSATNSPYREHPAWSWVWATVCFLISLLTALPLLVGYWGLVFHSVFFAWLGMKLINRPTYIQGLCRNCSYDLRGTIAAGRTACPECGHAVAPELDQKRAKKNVGGQAS